MTKKKTVEDVKKAQEVVSLIGKVIPSEISQEDYLPLIKARIEAVKENKEGWI